MAESTAKAPRQQIEVTATGRLGATPERKGKLTVSSLAVNQRVKVNGEWTNGDTIWLDLKATGDELESLEKGQLCSVCGRVASVQKEGRVYWSIWVTSAQVAGEQAKATQGKGLAFPE